MTNGSSGGCDYHPSRRNSASRSAARWLALAASPTFALMALLSSVLGGGQADMRGAAATMSPLGGMITMYLLMSAFHVGAWLSLMRAGARRVGSHRHGRAVHEDTGQN